MLTPADLEPFATIPEAKALAMIADALAMATRAAPCLADESVFLSPAQEAAVMAILRRAVLRWNDVGTGAITQQTAGSFSQSVDTTKTASKSLFWPSEINDLQDICRELSEDDGTEKQVFTIVTGHRVGGQVHTPWCSVAWGAPCSCGSYLNNFNGPIPEYGEMP